MFFNINCNMYLIDALPKMTGGIFTRIFLDKIAALE